MSKTIRNLIWLALSLIGTGFGIALSIQADIGIGAYDAFSKMLAEIFHTKIGTMMIINNSIALFIQWIILRKKFEIRRLLQFGMAFSLGYIINFFLYIVLQQVVMQNYIVRLLFFIIGQATVAISVGVLLAINYVSFPLEPAIMVLSERFGWNFAKARQLFDVLLIVIVPIGSWLFSVNIPLREGTVIGMIIFTPIMNFSFKYVKSFLLKESQRIA